MKRDSAIPLILLAVMSAVSCIKEDRSDCPCRLVLDFRDVDTSIVRAADIRLTSEEGFGFNDVVASSGFEGYMITVPRTTLQVCAWAGAGDCLNEDMSVSIPLGQECPRLFLHVSSDPLFLYISSLFMVFVLLIILLPSKPSNENFL